MRYINNNTEVKRLIISIVIISISATSAALYIGSITCAIIIAVTCFLLAVLFLAFTYSRYRKISEITTEIDRILHGDEKINIDSYREGELGLLQSEIYKMTVRLREQTDTLKNDKSYLANSIADISHQLRTPLTSMNLILSFLRESEIDENLRINFVNDLYVLTNRIDWLISTLLKMSKIDSKTAYFKSLPVLVEDVVKLALETLMISMDLHDQKLTTHIEGQTYIGDISWSAEAIGNIVKNCMEHTPTGGNITIESCQNAVYTEILIYDNGSGIDEADMPNIFRRFYNGKGSGDQSIGIGLALARMIITAQNGIIKANNRHNGGAEFTIRFYKNIV